MHKKATKCNKTQSKWCINKHGASKIIDTFEMYHGLLKINHIDKLCDACLAGKQRRAPFPQTAKFRVTEKLKLVHGDLCGPISPPTPGGKRYFLLLVDDHICYLWLTMLASKNDAETAIKRFKASAEVQSG
jgi:hypothetical protein